MEMFSRRGLCFILSFCQSIHLMFHPCWMEINNILLINQVIRKAPDQTLISHYIHDSTTAKSEVGLGWCFFNYLYFKLFQIFLLFFESCVEVFFSFSLKVEFGISSGLNPNISIFVAVSL